MHIDRASGEEPKHDKPWPSPVKEHEPFAPAGAVPLPRMPWTRRRRRPPQPCARVGGAAPSEVVPSSASVRHVTTSRCSAAFCGGAQWTQTETTPQQGVLRTSAHAIWLPVGSIMTRRDSRRTRGRGRGRGEGVSARRGGHALCCWHLQRDTPMFIVAPRPVKAA